MNFLDFCRQHRCYRELERYFATMPRAFLVGMTCLNCCGKLSIYHPFAVAARKFEFITRNLRLAYEHDSALPMSYGRSICTRVSCDDCWYERG